MLVEVGAVRAGHRVLVSAAAGGVGHLAVQIAKSFGAYVIGTAQRAKHEFVRAQGADEVSITSPATFRRRSATSTLSFKCSAASPLCELSNLGARRHARE
ncbi:hypothetical protein [Nocardia gipuzkoensis]|uniref:hypothetical protein n=1 Tax=Nocardia gipuzkoensis TaxID=2749991 RepID=UPI001F336FDE|nr:hypothetical protein [Nocardia gipuzkoensis]